MVLSGTILVALAVLFLLTTMALAASGQLRHPARVLAGLVALLVAGLALLFE
jgi:hypothetical protein